MKTADIRRLDEVRIDGMPGVWVVREIRGADVFCARLYTAMRDWFPLSSLTAEVRS